MIIKDTETPKYKKKKGKKNPKKADHKHEYVPIDCDEFLKIGGWKNDNYSYWVMITLMCTICGKKIKEHKSLSEEEKSKFILQIEKNKKMYSL